MGSKIADILAILFMDRLETAGVYFLDRCVWGKDLNPDPV